MPMLLHNYKIHHARPSPYMYSPTSPLLLLLLLRVGSHFLAESKIRYLQADQRSDAHKKNQEQRDDGGKTHEQTRCEVLVPFKQATLVACRIRAFVVCAGVTLELHLNVITKRTLHLILILLLGVELGLCLRFCRRGGDVDDGVVLGFGIPGEVVFEKLICGPLVTVTAGMQCAKRTLLGHVQRPERLGRRGSVELYALDRSALCLQVLCNLSHINLSDNIRDSDGRLDVVVLAGHVLRQSWRGAPICVIGGRDSLLLNNNIVFGRAFLQRLQNIGGDAGRLCDGCARGLQEQAVDVSFGTERAAAKRTRRWRRGRRARCC